MAEAKLSWPPPSFFGFPPSPHPKALPPTTRSSFKAPFAIPPSVYEGVLSPKVPLTFAFIYMVSVALMNRVNRRRGNKPWAVSKTSLFYVFVILHNAFLAIYSGITCAILVRALHVSVVSPFQEAGLASTLDSFCKIQGPRGLGDAVTYNPLTQTWGSANRLVQLGTNGSPDPSDVGRIWSEGLSFWGWIFYLSKFYEVVDTMVILAKGKRSSTLQTYHHAGAMLSMWAGIRYMSPPIWMFVLVNSGIHTLMYTYYTLSTVSIKVPGALKRLLTTMQILQFIVGVAFAGTHLFVSYSIPVTVPVKIAAAVPSAVHTASSAVNAATSAVKAAMSSSAVSETTQTVTATGVAALGDPVPYLKKALLYAVGMQHLELRDASVQAQHAHQQAPLVHTALEEIQYRKENQMTHCLDTSGQAFAIWLNVLYLFPLTVLFMRFFVKSYILGQPAKPSKPTRQSRRISASAIDAARRTSQTIETFGKSIEESIDTLGHEIQEGGGDIKLQDSPIEDGHIKKTLVNGTIHEESDDKNEPNGVAKEVKIPETAVEDGEEGKPLLNGSTSKDAPARHPDGDDSSTDEEQSMSEDEESEDAVAHAASSKRALEQELNGVNGHNHEQEQDTANGVGQKAMPNGVAHDDSEDYKGKEAGEEEAEPTTSKDQPNGKIAASDLLHRRNS